MKGVPPFTGQQIKALEGEAACLGDMWDLELDLSLGGRGSMTSGSRRAVFLGPRGL